MRSILVLLAAVSSLYPLESSSQTITDLRTAFMKNLHQAADSLLRDERAYADTLFSRGDAYTMLTDSTLRARTDSLLAGEGDSIGPEDREMIQTLALDMMRSLRVDGVPARTTVRFLLKTYEMELLRLSQPGSAYEAWSTPADFDSGMASFRGLSDSLSDCFGDSMATAVEEWETVLDESVRAFTDSIDARVSEVRELHAADLENHASRLEAEAAYESHSSYRGRDNGINESAFGPTLTFHHHWGLFAEGSIGWVSRQNAGPDEGLLSGGYEFTLSSNLSGSVAYAHFWYSDSSTKPQSVTNQNLAGMLLLDVDVLSFTLNVSDDFGGGGGSEITTSLDIAKDFLICERAFGGTLKITPTVNATWGDQNEKLRERRIVRAKKKKIVRISGKPLDLFGIMSYEISLPATLEIAGFSIEPFIGYIAPVNLLNGKTVLVKDPSTSDPFFSAGLTVSMTVR